MDEKAKITVEIPGYLKAWIKTHDVGQNAIVRRTTIRYCPAVGVFIKNKF